MERTILSVSLAGIVLVMHLGLQLTTGFANGCFGLTVVPGALASCSRLIHGGVPLLAGIPVASVMTGALSMIAAGTALFFGVAYVRPRAARWVGLVRLVLLGAAAGMTVYYVAATVSAPGGIGGLAAVFGLTVGTMLLLAVTSTLVSPRTHVSLMATETLSPRMFRRETALYLYLVVLTAVLVGADFAAYDALSMRSAPPAPTATVAAEPAVATGDPFRTAHLAAGAAASAVPSQKASRSPGSPGGGACGYDDSKEPVERHRRLVNMEDPSAGDRGAPVTVVEFFDPNCPHCATFHSVMKTLIQRHGDDAQFVFKPIPLGQQSVNQIEALYAANRAGLFTDMLEAQYARQRPGGLSDDDLLEIADEIGMNDDDLLLALKGGSFMRTIRLVYKQAQGIGVNSTPTVLINGRFVTSESRTVECLSSLIEEAG